jgi:hypothetical protein
LKIFRSTRIALLFLGAFFLQVDRAVASAATVPGGACLYALDPSAVRAFQIASAQPVYTACGVVVESSASDAFEMDGSETFYLQDHAQVGVVGGWQLNGQLLRDTINNQQVQPFTIASPGDPFAATQAPNQVSCSVGVCRRSKSNAAPQRLEA